MRWKQMSLPRHPFSRKTLAGESGRAIVSTTRGCFEQCYAGILSCDDDLRRCISRLKLSPNVYLLTQRSWKAGLHALGTLGRCGDQISLIGLDDCNLIHRDDDDGLILAHFRET